jgi:hypothetical protein
MGCRSRHGTTIEEPLVDLYYYYGIISSWKMEEGYLMNF